MTGDVDRYPVTTYTPPVSIRTAREIQLAEAASRKLWKDFDYYQRAVVLARIRRQMLWMLNHEPFWVATDEVGRFALNLHGGSLRVAFYVDLTDADDDLLDEEREDEDHLLNGLLSIRHHLTNPQLPLGDE